MASKYYEQHHDHTPLSDVGLTVALAVTIVTLVKLLMYGLTYVSLVWLFITLLYILTTTISTPHSSVRKFFTVFYLFISFIAIYAAFVYDYPVLPKSESHLKADIEDEEQQVENDNNSKVIIETPKPVAVETDNIVKEDESTFEEVDIIEDVNNDESNLSNSNIDEYKTDESVTNDINFDGDNSSNENSFESNIEESGEKKY